MREDILDGLQKEVYDRCIKPANQFGVGCYEHIVAVVKNAAVLAEQYGADKEMSKRGWEVKRAGNCYFSRVGEFKIQK